MSNRFRKPVACLLLAQVLLVGSLGTGLHDLFGCQHGEPCVAGCCVADQDQGELSSACDDCVFCRRDAAKRLASHRATERQARQGASITQASCDGCAVCNLLAQYHNVTPFALDSLSIELASGEAAIRQQNAVIAASVRLAISRGPPAV